MNKINFTTKDNFPLSSDTMEMMQQMIGLNANMALLGGANYILSGCVDDGNGNISAGLVVIGGEILPFEAGTKKAKITIQQTSKTLTAFGVEYPEAYLYRTAKFSDTGDYNWSDFVQVLTNKQLQQKIEAIAGDIPGIVKMWSGRIDRIPADYKLCDGSLLTINDYPELFENIGVSFGGNGTSNFALPDIRGRFVVGYDSSNPAYNAISKDKVGGIDKVTLTVSQIPEHDHVKNTLFNKLSAKAGDIDDQSTPGSIDQANAAREYNVGSMSEDRWLDATIQKVGDGQAHENRPPYYVLAYVIKVK